MNNNNDKQNKNNIIQKNSLYTCILHCPLETNDCVNSIDIFNNFLVYGTIMGNINFCRLEEEDIDLTNLNNLNIINQNINDINTNNYNQINIKNYNDLNKTDSNISDNKDIILKDSNSKEILLHINKENNFHTKKVFVAKNENKTRNEKDSPECIKLNLRRNYIENQSTNNFSSNNFKKMESSQKNPNTNNLIFPKFIKILQGSIENICCISLYNDILNFSIGDLELIHCEKISSFYGNDISLAHKYKRSFVYQSDNVHSEFCENCSCFMTNNNFLIVYSYYCDFNWPIRINPVKYDNRNLYTDEIITGIITMSNYNVPFDFDGDNFLYLEYYEDSTRSINIYKTLKDKKKFKYLLDKAFGHISHMKLLPDNCIFLCRNLFLCEIYKYKKYNVGYDENNYKTDDFILINKWVHNQNKEIISSNVYILGSKVSYEYKAYYKFNKNDNYKNSNFQIKKDNNNYNKYSNLNHSSILHNLINEMENSSIDSSSSKNKILGYERERDYNFKNYNGEILHLESDICNKKNEKIEKIEKIERKKNKKDSLQVNINDSDDIITQKKEKSYYIITLDIDGNFNLYYNTDNCKGIQFTLFNLYKIENISQRYKNLKFFSIGYPYYITMNELYYVITTDNGIFIINRKKDF